MATDPYQIALTPSDSEVTRDIVIQRWLTAIYNQVSGGSGGTVNSITGTAGQIVASSATGAVKLSLASAITGLTSITNTDGSNITSNGTGQLTVAAGGTNQNLVLTPSGSGSVIPSANNTMALGSLTNVWENIYVSFVSSANTGVLTLQTGNSGSKTALAISSSQVSTFTPATGGTATTTPGLIVSNTTASTSGATVQYSPSLQLIGRVWNTSGTPADNFAQMREELRPTSSASPFGTLVWSFSLSTTSTPSYTDVLSLHASGSNAVLGSTAGFLLQAASGQSVTVGTSSNNPLSIGVNTTLASSTFTWTGGTFTTNNLTLGSTTGTVVATSGVVSVTPGTASVSTVAAGTAYTMTNAFANVAFGTTSPTVTLTVAGTYLIHYGVQTSLVGATYAAIQQVNYLMNRQNNTPATIAGTSFSSNLPVVTTATDSGPNASGFALYTTANTTDVIGIQADVSATPSAGSVTCSAATITAVYLHP